MTINELRQAWIRSLIANECDGNKSAFAKQVGLDASYVNRMLWPEGRPNARSIGEPTIAKIAAKFGPPPAEAAVAAGVLTGTSIAGQRERDIAAQNMVIRSLAHALMQSAPGAAKVFSEHLAAQAKAHKPKPFATNYGLLAEVLGIAARDQSSEADVDQRGKRLGSGKRSS